MLVLSFLSLCDLKGTISTTLHVIQEICNTIPSFPLPIPPPPHPLVFLSPPLSFLPCLHSLPLKQREHFLKVCDPDSSFPFPFFRCFLWVCGTEPCFSLSHASYQLLLFLMFQGDCERRGWWWGCRGVGIGREEQGAPQSMKSFTLKMYPLNREATQREE